MPVQGHNVRLLGGKPVMDHDLTSAGLVKDGNLYPVSETAGPVDQDDVHILDE